MGAKLFFTTLVFLVVVGVLEAAVAPVHTVFRKPGGNAQKCVCMNGKWCEGEIINDVQCHPSYIMVCCIQPEPEPNPPYPIYPQNRFQTETKEPGSKPQSLGPLVQKPLPTEKLSEVNKETPAKQRIDKGEYSSKSSSKSSEDIKKKEN